MNRFAKLMLVTIGFGVLGFVMSLVPQKTAKGTVAAQVNVVNTPLPVTGNVNATINGTPTVNVANIPPVNVNFPSSIGVNGSVSVTNPFNGFGQVPLAISDLENRDRAPIGFVSLDFESTPGFAGSFQATSSFTVPMSARFVIDQIDGLCTTTSGNIMSEAQLLFNSGGSVVEIFLPLTPQPPTPVVVYGFNLPVHYVADPGSSFTGGANTTDGSGLSRCIWNVSGHLLIFNLS